MHVSEDAGGRFSQCRTTWALDVSFLPNTLAKLRLGSRKSPKSIVIRKRPDRHLTSDTL
jgi:hypothetical protein